MVREFDQRAIYQTYGQVVAPAAGAVIATTPAIFEWDYIVSFVISAADTAAVAKRIDVQLYWPPFDMEFDILGSVAPPGALWTEVRRTRIAQDMTIRAVAGAAGANNSVYTASIKMWMVP